MTSSKHDYLPQAPSPNVIPLAVRNLGEIARSCPINCCSKARLANKLVGRGVKESKAVPLYQDGL